MTPGRGRIWRGNRGGWRGVDLCLDNTVTSRSCRLGGSQFELTTRLLGRQHQRAGCGFARGQAMNDWAGAFGIHRASVWLIDPTTVWMQHRDAGCGVAHGHLILLQTRAGAVILPVWGRLFGCMGLTTASLRRTMRSRLRLDRAEVATATRTHRLSIGLRPARAQEYVLSAPIGHPHHLGRTERAGAAECRKCCAIGDRLIRRKFGGAVKGGGGCYMMPLISPMTRTLAASLCMWHSRSSTEGGGRD